MKKRMRFLISLLLFISPNLFAQSVTVTPTGDLNRDGKAYRAVGVNYVDAFWRVMDDPADTSYDAGFADLAAEEIPFARIAATPFYPSKLRKYQTDREGYLERLDGVIRSAEKHGVGLVISMFWANFTVPDVAGEPRNQWGNPDSATIAFMREYTETIVERYLDSPAIWMWEFGNEYNLAVDLPNAAEHRPPFVPRLGTPGSRSEADDIGTSDILTAYREFVKTIRAIDPNRPITSGNSMPRPHAERIRHSSEWTPIDTRAAFQQNIALVNPEGMNVISVHMYPDHQTQDRFAKGNHATYLELLSAVKEVATKEGKPAFLGEFGASLRLLDSEEAVAKEFDDFLDAIVDSKIDLAAVWNFDFADKRSVGQAQFTITRDNARGYMLDAIRATNLRLKNESAR